MIIKFKIFESLFDDKTSGSYWKIPTKDPDLEIALSKINGCDLKREDFYNSNNLPLFESDYVYIIYEFDIEGYIKFHWISRYIPQLNKYDNLGEIKVSSKEIEKYNLNQNIKKYNL